MIDVNIYNESMADLLEKVDSEMTIGDFVKKLREDPEEAYGQLQYGEDPLVVAWQGR